MPFIDIVKNEIASGYLITQLHDHFKGVLSGAPFNWQVVYENKADTQSTHLYLAPPATETVGNAQVRDVVHLNFTGSQILLSGIAEALQAFPQVIRIESKTGGTASNGITLDGVTIEQAPASLNAANTEHDNLYHLFAAITGSAAAPWTEWDWVWQQGPSDTNLSGSYLRSYIYGVRKVAAANKTLTGNANVTAATNMDYRAAGIAPSYGGYNDTPMQTLTIDLINGFSYAIQVGTRDLQFTTKTINGIYGPCFAAYADHAAAEAQMPVTDPAFSRFVSPVELYVGTIPNAGTDPVQGYATHIHAQGATGVLVADGSNNYRLAGPVHPLGFGHLRGVYTDVHNPKSAPTFSTFSPKPTALLASGQYGASSTLGRLAVVHRAEAPAGAIGEEAAFPYDTTSRVVYWLPPATGLEVYRVFATLVNEARLLSGDTSRAVTLQTAMDGTSDYPAINLSNTADLPSSGTVLIGGEAVDYTGKTSGSITGCTRATNGSKRLPHAVGSVVLPGQWFVKINGGALLAGHVKPV